MKQPGQIVLFHFPQTDLSEGKLRPALLVGPLPGPYDDWLICMISSQTHQYLEGFDEIVAEEHSDFEASGLKRTSIIRTRSEEHTSELQSRGQLVCRLLLEKKNTFKHI